MMTKSLFSIILLLAFSANATAYDFMVEGICYDKCPDTNNSIVTSESNGMYSDVKGNLIDSMGELHIENYEPMTEADPESEGDDVPMSTAIMPKFPGGDSALMRTLSELIQYPKAAAMNYIEGKVIVQFIVEKDGSIADTRIVRSVNPDLDKEAERVCMNLPNFIPGRNENNEPVRVWYTMPISFKISYPDSELIEDAESGDVIAQYKLGYIYYSESDYVQALHWLQKAASQGHDEASYLLPIVCALNQDYKQATEWYKKAHDTDEDVNTGDMIYGFVQELDSNNKNKEVELLTNAANLGNTHAMLDLIFFYADFKNSDRDEDEAIKFYKLYKKTINEPINNITIADVYCHIYKSKYNSDEYLEKAVDLGHIESQVLMGEAYYHKNQYDKAVSLFEKAMRQGNTKAQLNLGICYANGYGVEQDSVKSTELIAKAAQSGDAIAQYYLAIHYYNGFGVSQDKDKAIQWFVKAASQGCKEAIEALIVLYEDGVGKRAITFYRQEAENGNVSAQNILGNCYYYGDGVKQDFNQAIYWYQKVAENDDKTARLNLAKLYAHLHDYKAVQNWLTIDYADIPYWLALRFDNGESDTGDTLLYIAHKIYPNKEYLDFLEDGASLGHLMSLKYLACIYAIGKDVNRDDKKAVNLYNRYLQSIKDIAKGVTIADVYYSITQHYNDIISKQRGDEDQWLLKAGELGSSDALWELIKKSKHKEDYSQTIIWLQKLAQQDNSQALCILGDYYEHGKGVTQDHKTAIEWYKRAADRGDHDAQNIIGECYLKGDVLPKDPQKAVEMFKKAIEVRTDNPYYYSTMAYYNLGVCYYEGLGVEQDYDQAAYFFEEFNILYRDNRANSAPTVNVLYDSFPDDRDHKEHDTKDSDDTALAKQACYYAIGKDVDRDEKIAVELFSQYLSNTNKPKNNVTIADVHYYLYQNYYSIMGLNHTDDEIQSQERHHLETAAEMGLAEAQYELGKESEQNAFWGYKEDYENAAIWFEMAAAQGYMDAQYELAKLYENGNGVPQDDKQAAELYKKAAEQGHMEALYNLGRYYSNGKAGLKDLKLANECFYKVATSYKTVAEERMKRNKENN